MEKINSKLLTHARNLRVNQTDAEQCLWQKLRRNQFFGLKFRRQAVIAGYIVDFVCIAQKLIIELDGGQHATQTEYDAQRTKKLNQLGYRVLRFWNHEVLQNLDGVLNAVYLVIDTPPP